MTNLIITSPRPNQLVSGVGDITWVDLDGSDRYHIEIVLGGQNLCHQVQGEARTFSVDWDKIAWCNAAKVIVKREVGGPGAEVSPLVIPRHLPPIPRMVAPTSGSEAWSEVIVEWSPVMGRDVDGMPFRAMVQAKQGKEWVVVKECRPTDDMAVIDCRQFEDAPLVLRVLFENEAGSTTSSESTINIRRQGGCRIDVKPPVVDISHVVAGGKITFSLSGGDDGSGISNLRIKQDDGEWGPWLPYSPSFDVDAQEDGVSRFFFQFVDHAGNMAEATAKMFREVYHNATSCVKVGKHIVAACDSLVVTPGRSVIPMPGNVTCLGAYKGMAVACVDGSQRSSLVQASEPPIVLWEIPDGKATHMVESHGVLYIGCDNGNVYSFSGGAGFLAYVADKISSMGVLNGSLIVGCAKQGLVCFNGTTWEKI